MWLSVDKINSDYDTFVDGTFVAPRAERLTRGRQVGGKAPPSNPSERRDWSNLLLALTLTKLSGKESCCAADCLQEDKHLRDIAPVV